MIGKNWENNVAVALNLFYAKKEKDISCLCSKNKSNHEKHYSLFVIILMIQNGH